jgi:hypothetical protein
MPAPTHTVTIPIAIERHFAMLTIITSGRVLEPGPSLGPARTRDKDISSS